MKKIPILLVQDTVMSKIVVGFTNAATVMMGEKGADMINNQSQVSSSDESNAKDELGNLFFAI
jgi:hypothetical protein